MGALVSIVEGHGEVESARILISRVANAIRPDFPIEIGAPIRVRKDQFLNRPEIRRRFLELAAAKAGANGFVLVLLDADQDCPADIAATIQAECAGVIGHIPSACVLASKEFECWLIAAADSLAGARGLPNDLVAPDNPDDIRAGKEWIEDRMVRHAYSERRDQPALTARFDLSLAHSRSRSFRKLWKELDRAVLALDASRG